MKFGELEEVRMKELDKFREDIAKYLDSKLKDYNVPFHVIAEAATHLALNSYSFAMDEAHRQMKNAFR